MEWLDVEQPHPGNARYVDHEYVRCGASGLKLPRLALGFWHNFGAIDDQQNCKRIVYAAFDRGITYFDLANNYGPPPGAAEESFGRILKSLPRDEIIVATKAGYYMWPGPYGTGGSRKHLLASLDQSLRRLGLDYVDIFYHHRPDPEAPAAESLGALDHAVHSGKAVYVGLSNYSAQQTTRALDVARERELVAPIVNQSQLNLVNRAIDDALLSTARREKIGLVAFAPLAQGLLSGRYLSGIPAGSRASRRSWDRGQLREEHVGEDARILVRGLADLATARGQTIAQMATSWVLRPRPAGSVTTIAIGASSVEQLGESIAAVGRTDFTEDELARIDKLVADFQMTSSVP
jgi:L-glyceraldehyde 3-phosphate reductase